VSRRRPRPRWLVATVLAASGCAASPEPAYYALAPSEGAPRRAGPRTIELRHPALAGYLDRARIVVRVADYRLRFATGERWAEPLDDMIGRVLAEDLSDRLPGSAVFRERAASARAPDAVVDVDIERFDAGADGAVTLRAQVAVGFRSGGRTTTSRSLVLSGRPAAVGTPALAATMSELLGRLADAIAVVLAGPPGPPG